MIQNYSDEIGKYLKKKDSDVSKCKMKSRHKHEYIECLFVIEDHYHRGEYCKLCGKIRDVMLFETGRTRHNGGRILSREEIYEKYKKLEKVRIKSFGQKYIENYCLSERGGAPNNA